MSHTLQHDDVIKWKHFPRNWPFVRGIRRSPVNSPHKGQWRRALMFSLICVWINDWVNNREAGDLRRYLVHYDVIVMVWKPGNDHCRCSWGVTLPSQYMLSWATMAKRGINLCFHRVRVDSMYKITFNECREWVFLVTYEAFCQCFQLWPRYRRREIIVESSHSWQKVKITHWGRVTHICVRKLNIHGSDYGRHQAIIWTNAGILLIGPLGPNFIEILIAIQTFSFKEIHLSMSSGKWWPFCLGLNVLFTMSHTLFYISREVDLASHVHHNFRYHNVCTAIKNWLSVGDYYARRTT